MLFFFKRYRRDLLLWFQVLHETFPQHTFLMNGLVHGVKVRRVSQHQHKHTKQHEQHEYFSSCSHLWLGATRLSGPPQNRSLKCEIHKVHLITRTLYQTFSLLILIPQLSRYQSDTSLIPELSLSNIRNL